MITYNVNSNEVKEDVSDGCSVRTGREAMHSPVYSERSNAHGIHNSRSNNDNYGGHYKDKENSGRISYKRDYNRGERYNSINNNNSNNNGSVNSRNPVVNENMQSGNSRPITMPIIMRKPHHLYNIHAGEAMDSRKEVNKLHKHFSG